MMQVFADTAYWIALTSPGDALHEPARAACERLGETKIMTSTGVLQEYLTFFAGHGPYWRAHAAQRVEQLLAHPSVVVEQTTAETFRAALVLYRERLDKAYSFTDCESMHIMKRDGIREALTADHHFQQEGFAVLLRIG